MSQSTFLQKMRKGQLEQLSSELGLNGDGLRKTQLEILIDEYLTRHSEFADDARFSPFYKRRGTRSEDVLSPVKREAAGGINTVEKVAKTTRRRVTKAAEEIANTLDEQESGLGNRASSAIAEPASRTRNAISSTPQAIRQRASAAESFNLPASPRDVMHLAERQTSMIRHKISEVVDKSGVVEYAHAVRTTFSDVYMIELFTLVFEFYNLRPEVLPDRNYITPIIPIVANHPHTVRGIDLMDFFTIRFWQPFTLWLATSLLVPLFFSFFFNITSRSRKSQTKKTFDPLSFSIIKALITYAVYAKDVEFGGLVDLESVARIRSAMAGGWQGVVAGAIIGVVVTFYEVLIEK